MNPRPLSERLVAPERPAGRRAPRPTAPAPCRSCGALLGRNYRACPACHEAVEAIWRRDWIAWIQALGIASESPEETALARFVAESPEPYVWTIADYALTRFKCDTCGQEAGGGPADCPSCAFMFGNLWAPNLERGATLDEHALRVARLVVRHPHRHSPAVAAGWRLSLAAVLAGGIGTGAHARRLAAWLKAGGDPALLERFATSAKAVAWLETHGR